MDQQFHSGSCLFGVLFLFWDMACGGAWEGLCVWNAVCYYWVIYVLRVINCFTLPFFQKDQKQDLLFDTFWLMTFFESVSLIGSQEITNVMVSNDDSGFLLPYVFAATLSVVGILYIRNASSTTQHASAIGSYQKSFFAHVLRGEWWVILLASVLSFSFLLMQLYFYLINKVMNI